MIRAFFDAGSLIVYYQGNSTEQARLRKTVASGRYYLLTSRFVEMETRLPAIRNKAHYTDRELYESYLRFLDRYFAGAEFSRDYERMLDLAYREALKPGITTFDALHIAAAHLLRSDVFVTTEKRTKPMYGSSLVKRVVHFSEI